MGASRAFHKDSVDFTREGTTVSSAGCSLPSSDAVIILATNNSHKAEEFENLFRARKLPLKVFTAAHVGGMPAVAEDTGTFLGNARQKARALHAAAPPHFWVMADDSGLVCDALDGAPGVESANYAGPHAPDAANRAKLLAALHGVPKIRRTAFFFCQLLLISPGGNEFAFEGKCPGRILDAESGTGGFGYDALFLPDGAAVSFAELPSEEKNRLSHRGRAFEALAEWLESKTPRAGEENRVD
ncbi:MAG: RdgB/HAM1 family non-canonical purine NTP pyrophosphatase [Puniceicoccales bacterium]|jgi:XTP/dITP diphosphohydrolase|nr:RdgB/HAM1 family non-canonical purine NTP pyrophosphatase [Puniceicoccales bacterium]